MRRYAPVLFVASLLFIGTSRQALSKHDDCLFPNGAAVPDTLDPIGYFPLEIGNVWEYATFDGPFMGEFIRREVVDETTVQSEAFFELRTQAFERQAIDTIRMLGQDTRWIAVRDSGIVSLVGGAPSFTCIFRRKSATVSEGSRPGITNEVGHRLRTKSATHYERSRPLWPMSS